VGFLPGTEDLVKDFSGLGLKNIQKFGQLGRGHIGVDYPQVFWSAF
jgi:hypothetical protein